jgi:hypothetical protein
MNLNLEDPATHAARAALAARRADPSQHTLDAFRAAARAAFGFEVGQAVVELLARVEVAARLAPGGQPDPDRLARVLAHQFAPQPAHGLRWVSPAPGTEAALTRLRGDPMADILLAAFELARQ